MDSQPSSSGADSRPSSSQPAGASKTPLFTAPEPLCARNRRSGVPSRLLCARNRCSSVPSKPLCARKSRLDVPSRPLYARNRCSSVPSTPLCARDRCSSVPSTPLFARDPCSDVPSKLRRARNHCSKSLFEDAVSLPLSSAPLHCPPLCSVHGYARAARAWFRGHCALGNAACACPQSGCEAADASVTLHTVLLHSAPLRNMHASDIGLGRAVVTTVRSMLAFKVTVRRCCLCSTALCSSALLRACI